MRGDDLNQSAIFSYLSPEQRVPADHPLRAVRTMTDAALKALSPRFSRMYSKRGRPSIAPEKLLRTLLLQVLYSVRSERMLMEQLDFSMLFRWFVGLNLDDKVWDASTFSQNRERLLKGDVAEAFFEQVRRQAEAAGLLSDEHFTVDGTLVEAWAGQKSLRPVAGQDEPPPTGGRNPEVNFHGQKRANDTHISTTDPEAMLARKTRGSETKLAYRGHLLTENRNGLIVKAMVTHAYGSAETHAALLMLEKVPGTHALTCGADKGYDTGEFETECRNMNVVAHVARKVKGSAIPARRAEGIGYRISQRLRKKVEEPFGWFKTVGLMRKTRPNGGPEPNRPRPRPKPARTACDRLFLGGLPSGRAHLRFTSPCQHSPSGPSWRIQQPQAVTLSTVSSTVCTPNSTAPSTMYSFSFTMQTRDLKSDKRDATAPRTFRTNCEFDPRRVCSWTCKGSLLSSLAWRRECAHRR